MMATRQLEMVAVLHALLNLDTLALVDLLPLQTPALKVWNRDYILRFFRSILTSSLF